MSNSPDPTPNGVTKSSGGQQSEEALRRSEARYRALVEASNRAVWSWSPGGVNADFQNTMRWWEGVTGQTIAEQQSKDDAWVDMVHPDDREIAGKAWDKARATGAPYDVEYRVRAKEGGWRYVRARGVPVSGPDGTVLEWVGTIDDVTEPRVADAARREGEERLRLALEASGTGVWEWNVVTGRITWSEQVHAFYGMAPGEFDGTLETFARHLHPDDAARAREAIRASVEDDAPYRIEYRIVPKGGGVRWISTAGRVVRDAAGRPLRMIGATSDVTERRLAEDAIRASEERFRTLFDSMDQGFCVIEVTFEGGRATDYRFVELNPAFERHSGLPHDFLGKSIREVVPGLEEFWFDTYGRVALTGEPIRFVHHAAPLGRWFEVYAFRLEDADRYRVAVLFTDVTERRRAEADAVHMAERLRMALDAGGLGTWEWDPATDEMTVSARASEMYGTPVGVPHGREQGRQLIHPDDRERAREAAARAVAEKTDYDIEYRLADRPMWVAAHGRGLYDAAGELVRVHGVVQDITQRKRTELELRDQDRKKDDFIALLAHELRNPLAPIRNGLRVVRMSSDREVQERSQAMMDRQLGHMVRMIDDLLDVSRINRNKMELVRARVALSDVVASAVETARPALDAAGHELAVALPRSPVILDADLTRLAQVFSNLLTNSAKYTPKGGRVWLSAERERRSVRVTVRDTGIGIPKESLPSIFDMFSQVDRSVEKTTGGLGIGLALVKGLVEMHGGTVSAESDGEGTGTTFMVTLHEEEGADAPGPVTKDPARAPARRILVVDDNRDGAESMGDMLGLLGHEVTTAHDGLEAIERAEAVRPDVILMDVGMPRLNGLDATRRIREMAWGRTIRIVALTGWGQDHDREKSRAAGCDAHLVKPVDFADLQRVLAEVMA